MEYTKIRIVQFLAFHRRSREDDISLCALDSAVPAKQSNHHAEGFYYGCIQSCFCSLGKLETI